MWVLTFLKGTVSKDGYFFECLNILISSFHVCADGFQGLSKAFHYPIQLLPFYLLLWNYLLILKMLNENLSKVPYLWLVQHFLAPTSIFVPMNRIPSVFLFRGTEFQISFSFAEWFRTEFWDYAYIFIPRYRILSIFLLWGMVRNRILRVFCPAEHPVTGTNCSIYSIFRWIIFLSEIANPKYRLLFHLRHSLLGLELMVLFINW